MNFNIVTLISGRGLNLAALIREQKNYKIQAVISNNPSAAGIQFAKQANIPVYTFNRKDFEDLLTMKTAIREQTARLQPDLITLAGYMLLIEPEFIELYPDRIVNIHPSLLPSYPGLNTHGRVLADRTKIHGCTIHQVDFGLDTGNIIAQARLEVDPKDNEDILASRVMNLEQRLYPWTINAIASGKIKLYRSKPPKYSSELTSSAKQLGFNLGDNS